MERWGEKQLESSSLQFLHIGSVTDLLKFFSLHIIKEIEEEGCFYQLIISIQLHRNVATSLKQLFVTNTLSVAVPLQKHCLFKNKRIKTWWCSTCLVKCIEGPWDVLQPNSGSKHTALVFFCSQIFGPGWSWNGTESEQLGRNDVMSALWKSKGRTQFLLL